MSRLNKKRQEKKGLAAICLDKTVFCDVKLFLAYLLLNRGENDLFYMQIEIGMRRKLNEGTGFNLRFGVDEIFI